LKLFVAFFQPKKNKLYLHY